MVLLLICGAESFRVKDQHFNRVTIRREAVDWLAPDPNSLLKTKGRVSTHTHTHYISRLGKKEKWTKNASADKAKSLAMENILNQAVSAHNY